jgi:hypothetical protein
MKDLRAAIANDPHLRSAPAAAAGVGVVFFT